MDAFLTQGLPHSRTEEYKFTPVTRILDKAFVAPTPLTGQPVATLQLIPELKCNIVAFINGIYSDEHSSLIDKDVVVNRTIIDRLERRAASVVNAKV